MKIKVDNTELLTLTETQKNVIKDTVHADHFDEDMKRRIKYILLHKYEQCFKALKQKWDKKFLENGVKTIPTDPDEYAKLVFEQPNYKDRKMREAEFNVHED